MFSTGHSTKRSSLVERLALEIRRRNNEIGDDAFHQVEEQLDWMEMAGGKRED